MNEYKEFEEQYENLKILLKNQTESYLANKFKHGKEFNYVLNLIVNAHVGSMVQSMLIVCGSNLEMKKNVVEFSEDILEKLGYMSKDFKDKRIN